MSDEAAVARHPSVEVWQCWATLAGLRQARVVMEAAVVTVASMLALTIADEWIGVLVTLLLALLGGVVWLIRLEGKVTVQAGLLARMESDLGSLSASVRLQVERQAELVQRTIEREMQAFRREVMVRIERLEEDARERRREDEMR